MDRVDHGTAVLNVNLLCLGDFFFFSSFSKWYFHLFSWIQLHILSLSPSCSPTCPARLGAAIALGKAVAVEGSKRVPEVAGFLLTGMLSGCVAGERLNYPLKTELLVWQDY